jgi:NAD(P)-dependent dehydrogenase (short-subunit alcohol dehydrogenase family)
MFFAVTGSSQGIGRALLDALLNANYRAVATLRKPEVLASLQARYPPEQLLVVPLDVTDKAQVTAAFAATKERFGRLDVLVNSAGYGLQGEVEGLPEEEARKVVEVLFWAPVNISTQVRANL